MFIAVGVLRGEFLQAGAVPHEEELRGTGLCCVQGDCIAVVQPIFEHSIVFNSFKVTTLPLFVQYLKIVIVHPIFEH